MKRLIDKNQQKTSLYSELDEKDVELVKEVLEHAYFANECVDKFHAQKYLRTKVANPSKILFFLFINTIILRL